MKEKAVGKIVDTLLKDVATIKEAFIIDELQKYMDLSDPSNPKWIEPVRLRLLEKEDWKRMTREAIEKQPECYICACQGGDCPCLFKNKLLKELGLD